MNTRCEKFIDFLRGENIDFFEIHSLDESATMLLHTENQIVTKIIFYNSLRTDIYYEFAHCSNVLKQEQLLTFLNKLNEAKVIKFFWTEAGPIVANITYWADEESFNPKTLLNLYGGFYNILIDDHIVEQVMKIIWR